MNKNEFPIVFSSDNRGVLPLQIAIYSLLTAARPETFYRIYILANDIDKINSEKIYRLTKDYQCSLNFIDISSILSEYNFPYKANLPVATWSRIFIPDIIKNESGKILYLDIDVLVCDDLTDLFKTDINGKALGAVYEYFAKRSTEFNERLGIPLEYKGYFNAGVLLINIDFFREKKFSESLVKYTINNREKLTALDQDALNAVLYDSVVALHPRWNWNDRQSKRMLRRSLDEPFWNCATPQQEIEAATNPGILHYLGPHKPWRYNWRFEGPRYEKAMRAAGLLQGSLPGRTFSALLKKYIYKPIYWLTAQKIGYLKRQLESNHRFDCAQSITPPPPPPHDAPSHSSSPPKSQEHLRN